MLFVPYPDNFSAYWMWSVPLRSWCNFVRNDGGIINSAHAQTAHSLNYGYSQENNEDIMNVNASDQNLFNIS